MSEELSTPLIITGIALLVLFFWILSVLIVRWDVRRRNLQGFEGYIWPLLAALLPLFGFIVYLFSRFALPTQPPPAQGRRMTLFRPPSQPERRLPTIAAADLEGGTIEDRAPSLTPVTNGKQLPGGLAALPVLVVTEGPYTGREFYLDSLPAHIGRGANASIRLDEDLGVSRQHAEIFTQDGLLFIRDLNSTHGTLVNGLRVAERALKPGDQIQIGFTRLLIRMAKERR